jgi:hypothetical protein
MPILIERTSLLTVGASTSTPPCFVQQPLLISPWVTTELASAARLCLTQAPLCGQGMPCICKAAAQR